MQFPIFIDLRRSVRFSLLLVVAHSIAFGAVCAFTFAWQLRLLLLLSIVLAARRAFRAPAIVGLRILGSDEIVGVSPVGSDLRLVICEQSAVYRQMILLRTRLGNERALTSFVLFPDQMSQREFHQLRLWLRCQTQPMKDARADVS